MKTLILFLDAFSFTDLNEKNTPYIYSLAKKGNYGSLKTIPAGYHIEYSMLSGCLPLKHNVWAWYYMKPEGSFSKIKYISPLIKIMEKLNLKNQARTFVDVYINLIRLFQGKTRFLKTNKIPYSLLKKFEISVDKMHFEHNPLPVPTLFDIFRKNNIKYIAREFPVFSDNQKTGFYFTKGDKKQLKLAINSLKKYDVSYLHIWQLDALEHKYGLHSNQAKEYLKEIDTELKKLTQNKKMNIIIFSDHGGVNVTKTKNPLPIIKKYDCDYFIGSTTLQIWLKNKDKSKLDELKKELKQKDFLVYDKNNIEKQLFIPYKREFVGDVLAFVKPGHQIYPDFFRDTARVKSMHGYSEKTPELNGLFIISGFNLKNNKLKNMKLYDIAPTILKAFNIPLPKIWDGKSKI